MPLLNPTAEPHVTAGFGEFARSWHCSRRLSVPPLSAAVVQEAKARLQARRWPLMCPLAAAGCKPLLAGHLLSSPT
jgi:hypothetical protein